MQKSQMQVKAFHEKFQLVINDKPTVPNDKILELRCRLLLEEVKEFCDAAGYWIIGIGSCEPTVEKKIGVEPDLIEMADALGDIQYVNDGAAISLGIDLEKVGDEVHRSNMSKLWTTDEIQALRSSTENNWTATGSTTSGFVVKDQNGKAIKSPSYSPANIKQVLIDQGAEL